MDATDEFWQAVGDYYLPRIKEALKKNHEQAARRVYVGKWVQVFKGRKVPVGIQGIVFWTGTQKYGGHETERVGIRDELGQTWWTAASNVRVLYWERGLPQVDYDRWAESIAYNRDEITYYARRLNAPAEMVVI